MCNESTADLIRWIETHHLPERVIDNGDGTLTVACEVVAADNTTSIERSTIPATREAARDWLGY
ncbi:hypothetical protein [Burkholderia cenocepacia]|uniref:hypothetical protein n=1 Tax=Burkholderia cenocepacia TaxID=95486 RepID=UPI0022329582|nr:hypothetical protein [Burkholderia cenocepacia]MCW3657874.1 hypothetical protein [Burkholderia cenocepacia]MDS0805483.1 hypothetical protein [Burkholderia cenocepacia]